MSKSESEILNALGSHAPALRAMAHEAVDVYLKYPDVFRLEHSVRSHASLVHDHWTAAVMRYVEPRSDCKVLDLRGLVVLSIPDAQCVIRFKKLDDDKLPAGQQTQQVLDYRSQEQIDGLPEFTHLELGYQLNAEKKLAGVFLILPSGQFSNAWVAELVDDGAKSVVVELIGADTSEPTGGKVTGKKGSGVTDATESGNGDSGA